MAEAAGGEERIADLLRQWQESPTPRVGLQLAEEHRRLGRHADARAVLERSLEAHPGHLSSLVALGKTLLDLGEADAAAAQFERVVERDPTHLVAGKLLIEAHLRRGDEAGARARLDLYRLLNENDPEIEQLEARWQALEEAGGAASPAPVPASPAVEPEAVEAVAPEPAGEAEAAAAAADRPAAGEVAAAPPTEEAAEPTAAAPAPEPPAEGVPGEEGDAAPGATAGTAPSEPAPPARSRRHETGSPDPFGPLAAADDERRWLAGLGGHGIFPVELPPEPEPAPEVEPQLEAETEAELEAEPLSQSASAAEAETEVAAAAAAPEPPAAASADPEVGLVATGDEPAPADSRSKPAVGAEAAPSTRDATPAGPTAAAIQEAPAAEPGERATNTLGELYLAQGHLADAERVFRAVLARRPDDPAALAGLAEIERRRVAPLSATDLLEWARTRGERLPAGGGRRDRSSLLLRAYLARLRRRSPADVP